MVTMQMAMPFIDISIKRLSISTKWLNKMMIDIRHPQIDDNKMKTNWTNNKIIIVWLGMWHYIS